MKKTIKIKNLDCANCAAKLEDKINKITKVDNAVVNFLTQKIVIEATDEDFEELRKALDFIEENL